MAFGFFKKNETADMIFMGGKIYTQDPDLPWAESVACKDGNIIAVGNDGDFETLIGDNTEVVDLEGGTMLPGFINIYSSPVSEAFRKVLPFLEPADLDGTLGQISDFVAENPDDESYFICGYEENILNGLETEQSKALLDNICTEKTMLLLGESGIHCWFNSAAAQATQAAAEKDQIPFATLPYMLNLLAPIDLDLLQEAILAQMSKYCEKGFTAIFENEAPEYLDSAYQNMLLSLYNADMVKQRFYGSLVVKRNVTPDSVLRKASQKKTQCTELNEYINFNTIKITLDRNPGSKSITPELFKELCVHGGDKGFDIYVDAIGKEAVLEAATALEAARSAGYRKNSFTIAHNEVFLENELSDTNINADIYQTPLCCGAPGDLWNAIESADSVEAAIDMLTLESAAILGIDSRFGSIEKGKKADFCIFDENPLCAQNVATFKKLNVAMTIIDGRIVYDAQEDTLAEWYDLFAQQQF